MTIGQRIAQKRKELGLSQEALGEQLGLSRQAVYKWESDAALPEIDKLIALSRTFSVSVGWLLGVEDEMPGNIPTGEGELSEAQLAMVQEIVDRYLDAQQPQKRRKWPWLLGAAAAVIVVALFASLFSRLDTVSREYNNLNTAIQNVSTGVGVQISSITGRVEEILKSQNNLLADYAALFTGADLQHNTAFFSVRVVPKSLAEDEYVQLLADAGTGEVTIARAEQAGGGAFTAQFDCPLTDHITLYAEFITPGSPAITRREKLQTFDLLYSTTFPQVFVIDYLRYPGKEDSTFPAVNNYVRLQIEDGTNTASYYENLPRARSKQLLVGLFKDKKLAAVLEAREIQGVAPGGGTSTESYYFIPEGVPVDKSATYCVAVVVTDEYGRERICPGPMMQYDEVHDCWNGQTFYEYGPGVAEDFSDWEY